MENYYPMLKDAFGMFLFLGIELSVLFIIISAGVSLLQQYIPDAKIQAILSGSKGRGYVLAALLGAVTPFCSCSTIPMLRGLLRAKAGFGPTLTFLFTSPLLNPIILGLFLVTFGFKVTLIYTVVALIVSVVAGLILDKMGFERHVIPEHEAPAVASCCAATPSAASCCATAPSAPKEEASSCCATPSAPKEEKTSCCASAPKEEIQSCCATPSLQPLTTPNSAASCCATAPSAPKEETSSCCATPSAPKEEKTSCCGSGHQEQASASCCATAAPLSTMTFSQKVKKAFGDGWVQFKHVFPYLLIGVSLGAFVYGFVPSEFIAKYASGDSLLAVPIAAVIGIPLYVRVEALIPLSSALVGKGMGLGAVMALIIGGGGASLTEVILLKSMFRTPMIIAFLVVILGMAILAGYLFQFVF